MGRRSDPAPTLRAKESTATISSAHAFWSLAKGAVWSAATLDNNVGLFEGTTVEQINAFFGPKCDEVKDEFGK